MIDTSIDNMLRVSHINYDVRHYRPLTRLPNRDQPDPLYFNNDNLHSSHMVSSYLYMSSHVMCSYLHINELTPREYMLILG